MTNLLKLLIIGLVVFIFTGCSNKYMKNQTNQFKSKTSKVINQSIISSYKVGDTEFIGSIFDEATLELDHKTKEAVFTFKLSQNKLKEAMIGWKKTFPDIVVDQYNLIAKAKWAVIEPNFIGKTVWGDLTLRFFKMKYDLDIKGSGKNFKDIFIPMEQYKFIATKGLGIATHIVSEDIDPTSGINPMLPNGFKILSIEDESTKLKTNQFIFPTKHMTLIKKPLP